MPTHLLRHSLWLAGCCLAGVAFAQNASPVPPPPGAAAPSAQRPSRNMSRELSAALTAGIPFEDPKAAAKKKEQEEAAAEEVDEDVDLREIDKPRNTIIRLPKYVVEGERPPVFAERDIHTRKGLADLAVKRYLSSVHQALNKYRIPLIGMSNEQLALFMYEEDQRLKNMQDFGEKVYLYRATGDEAAAEALKQDVDRTFMRQSSFAEPPGRRD